MNENQRDKIIKRLSQKNDKINSSLNDGDIYTILHELDVFESELLAQNEELIEKERKLEEALDDFRILFNHSPIAMVLMTNDFLIEQYNLEANKIFKFSSSKLNKLSILNYISSKSMKDFFNYLDDKNFDESIILDYNIIKENKICLNKFKIKKEKISKNDIEYILLSLDNIQNDYENRKIIEQLQEEKIEQQKYLLKDKDALLIQQSKMAAMGEMIGNIAHQWRQPLNNLSISIGNLIYKFENDKNISKDFIKTFEDKTHSSISAMSMTIDEFKNFFNNDNTQEIVNVCESIKLSLKMIDDSLKYHNILVNCSLCNPLCFFGSKTEFSQVILNLLSNSKDALTINHIESPEININFFEQVDSFTIVIEDNAGGVPSDKLDKLVEPYFTTKKEHGGTGIGLYISNMIIKKINGKLKISNGKYGLRVEITLKKEKNGNS